MYGLCRSLYGYELCDYKYLVKYIHHMDVLIGGHFYAFGLGRCGPRRCAGTGGSARVIGPGDQRMRFYEIAASDAIGCRRVIKKNRPLGRGKYQAVGIIAGLHHPRRPGLSTSVPS